MAKNTVGMEVKPILLALLRHLLHSLTVNSGAFRALADCQTNDAENCHKVSSILAAVEYGDSVELVSKELNNLAATLHVYAGGFDFMSKKKLLLFFKKKMEILLHF